MSSVSQSMEVVKKQVELLDDAETLSNNELVIARRGFRGGMSAEQVQARLDGVKARKGFTEAAKQAVSYVDPDGKRPSVANADHRKEKETAEGKFIQMETDLIYRKIGFSRKDRKEMKKGVKRDYLSTSKLQAVALGETNVARVWNRMVNDRWAYEKAKQVRLAYLNKLAESQQFINEATGESV